MALGRRGFGDSPGHRTDESNGDPAKEHGEHLGVVTAQPSDHAASFCARIFALYLRFARRCVSRLQMAHSRLPRRMTRLSPE